MTTAEIIEYYSGLLIKQYYNQPNAVADIQTLITPVVMDQLPLAVMNAYNVDSTCVGVQLDVIGKYVGANRTGPGMNGVVTLNDSDFLLLIKLAIVRNAAGSSLGNIESFLTSFFAGSIVISDSADMTLNYSLLKSFGSTNLQSMILYQAENPTLINILPRPMGVGISVTFVSSRSSNFFTFRTYADPAPTGTTGFNDYDFVNPNSVWGTYETL